MLLSVRPRPARQFPQRTLSLKWPWNLLKGILDGQVVSDRVLPGLAWIKVIVRIRHLHPLIYLSEGEAVCGTGAQCLGDELSIRYIGFLIRINELWTGSPDTLLCLHLRLLLESVGMFLSS